MDPQTTKAVVGTAKLNVLLVVVPVPAALNSPHVPAPHSSSTMVKKPRGKGGRWEAIGAELYKAQHEGEGNDDLSEHPAPDLRNLDPGGKGGKGGLKRLYQT